LKILHEGHVGIQPNTAFKDEMTQPTLSSSSGAVLLTGVAGFIGAHTAIRLINDGVTLVVGLDNLNDYYNPQLKRDRLEHIRHSIGSEHAERFLFVEGDIADKATLESLFAKHQFAIVVNLAAQAGVRYSLSNPDAYVQSNIVGFVNILECCRHHKTKHLVYASSSSVYGGNTKTPFSESDSVDHPVSLYAATKKSNELMAHTYSHLFEIPTTGLRFFTVYGPWGRPDMAPAIFTKAILDGQPINLFNDGKMRRDFTFVDDIVEGLVQVMVRPPTRTEGWDSDHPDPATGAAPYRVFNIGNNNPTELMEFVGTLENVLGREAQKNYLPMQPGDVVATAADTDRLSAVTGFAPSTSLSEGLARYAAWYRHYYKYA
jgi:UDP-glucuronate 4-epimerase